MIMKEWLPLTEYSSKYRVSISTLRRRIKADDIKYQFQDGRYLIFDQPIEASPSPSPVSTRQSIAPSPSPSFGEVKFVSHSGPTEESVLEAANRLLTELKKAYSQILQEKEEQILHLKTEVSDLKTLVKVLEAENERLKP